MFKKRESVMVSYDLDNIPGFNYKSEDMPTVLINHMKSSVGWYRPVITSPITLTKSLRKMGSMELDQEILKALSTEDGQVLFDEIIGLEERIQYPSMPTETERWIEAHRALVIEFLERWEQHLYCRFGRPVFSPFIDDESFAAGHVRVTSKDWGERVPITVNVFKHQGMTLQLMITSLTVPRAMGLMTLTVPRCGIYTNQPFEFSKNDQCSDFIARLDQEVLALFKQVRPGMTKK